MKYDLTSHYLIKKIGLDILW